MRGRATFLAGNITLTLFATVHLLAVYNANFGRPRSEAEAQLHAQARSLATDLGPFHATAWGAIQILNASYSALLAYVAVLNFVSWRTLAAAGRLRAFTAVQVAFTAVLTVITVIYQFPPPMVFAGLALVLFLISWICQGRNAAQKVY